jgi:hypothetical protein
MKEQTKCYCGHTTTCDCGPEESKQETLEQYLQRLKDRRTEDDYKYTDEDFEKYKQYISDCCKSGMSVYKCLEFMYFAERDMDDQLFNREPNQEDMITKIMQMDAKMAYDSLPKQDKQMKKEIDMSKYTIGIDPYNKQETLEEAAKEFFRKFKHTHSPDNYYLALVEFAKWQQERSYSEKEVLAMLLIKHDGLSPDYVLEQFKKK